MYRSKNILDYFEALFTDLKADIVLPFDVYLYFQGNNHVLLWRKKGDTPAAEWLGHYASRGVTKIWLSKQERPEYNLYMNPPGAAKKAEAPVEEKKQDPVAPPADPEVPQETAPEVPIAPPEETVAAAPEEPTPETPEEEGPRTEEGAFLEAVLSAPDLAEKEKKEMAAAAAQAMLAQAAKAENEKQQKKANERMQKSIADVLDSNAGENSSKIAALWKVANIDPELEHAVNVATYAVTFAMAFGKIEPDLIGDIAMSGLLHDLGVSQVPFDVSTIPSRKMSDAQTGEYGEHLEAGLALLAKHASDTPARVRTIMHQHHEKFNGTGYPQKLKGFQFDDIAQVVSMADLMDAIGCGQWDGDKRTFRETLKILEVIDTSRTFPEFFNPEIFQAITRWIKKSPTSEAQEAALKTVAKQTEQIISKLGGGGKPAPAARAA